MGIMRELLGGKGSTWDEGWKKHDEDEKRLYEKYLKICSFVRMGTLELDDSKPYNNMPFIFCPIRSPTHGGTWEMQGKAQTWIPYVKESHEPSNCCVLEDCIFLKPILQKNDENSEKLRELCKEARELSDKIWKKYNEAEI